MRCLLHTMIGGAVSKVVSEMMLSLYPVFVKNIGLPLWTQMWTRFLGYIVVSTLFVDWKLIWKYLKNGWGLLLAGITLVHIYTSYAGFEEVKSGNAYTLFYIYPILILLFSGTLNPFLGALSFGGALLLCKDEPYFGVAMILLAALTEAMIYFVVLRLPTSNNWNHIFLSYFAGAVALTGYQLSAGSEVASDPTVLKALGLNSIIGLFGYYLRFYSMGQLSVFSYAVLSNVGIVMSYLYGYYFNGEIVEGKQIIGVLLIALACFFAKK